MCPRCLSLPLCFSLPLSLSHHSSLLSSRFSYSSPLTPPPLYVSLSIANFPAGSVAKLIPSCPHDRSSPLSYLSCPSDRIATTEFGFRRLSTSVLYVTSSAHRRFPLIPPSPSLESRRKRCRTRSEKASGPLCNEAQRSTAQRSTAQHRAAHSRRCAQSGTAPPGALLFCNRNNPRIPLFALSNLIVRRRFVSLLAWGHSAPT